MTFESLFKGTHVISALLYLNDESTAIDIVLFCDLNLSVAINRNNRMFTCLIAVKFGFLNCVTLFLRLSAT